MKLGKTVDTTAGYIALSIMLLLQGNSVRAQSSLLIESLQTAPTSFVSERTEMFKDWSISCPVAVVSENVKKNPSSCTIEPIAFTYQSDKNIMRFFGQMILVKSKKEPVFIIQTRLDLLLPEGITLQIDNSPPHKVAFRSCHASGCVIPFRLTPKIETAFKRGNHLKLSVYTLNGNREHITISLAGFTAAMEKMNAGKIAFD